MGGGSGWAAIASIMAMAPLPDGAPGHHRDDPLAWDVCPGSAFEH
jgi:hypothetical protein